MNEYARKLKCGVCNQKTHCFFNSLSEGDYDFLYSNKLEVDYKAGETIYKQGTESKYLIFLLSGMAKVFVEADSGKNFILDLVKPFQFLDMPAIFENNILFRSSSAIIDSRACLIDIDTFKSIILHDNQNVPRLLKHYNHINQRYASRLASVIYKNMEARISSALLYLINEVYFSRTITLTISRGDIAELAGMSRESTSRILRQLKDQEIIRLKGRELEILDKKYLEQLAIYG